MKTYTEFVNSTLGESCSAFFMPWLVDVLVQWGNAAAVNIFHTTAAGCCGAAGNAVVAMVRVLVEGGTLLDT